MDSWGLPHTLPRGTSQSDRRDAGRTERGGKGMPDMANPTGPSVGEGSQREERAQRGLPIRILQVGSGHALLSFSFPPSRLWTPPLKLPALANETGRQRERGSGIDRPLAALGGSMTSELRRYTVPIVNRTNTRQGP